MFAEHLAERGHEVHVLTSTAHEYTTWRNEYPAVDSVINDVTVHRLPVRTERTPEIFGPMHSWMIHGPKPTPTFQQRRWADLTGPQVDGLEGWLQTNAPHFDVAIFMTYMYTTTTRGLTAAAGRVPTILQPTAHDEPSIWIPLFETVLRMPDAFLYFTTEERAIVERRLRRGTVGSVVGIGVSNYEVADPQLFRIAHGLDDSPFLLYVGRVDSGKGTVEAAKFFAEYQRRNHSDLKLVVAGEVIAEMPQHPDIFYTGFLDERMKRSAMAGSMALLQPSYFESFSIVLCESWMQGRPALVQGRCDVLAGQVGRAGGGLPYVGYASFETSVDFIRSNPDVAAAMGQSGRRFVQQQYGWSEVLDGVESVIDTARDQFSVRRTRFGV